MVQLLKQRQMLVSTEETRAARRVGTGLSVAYVLDPRFPGGTSSAVAAELEVVTALADVQVYALETKMFGGRRIAPRLSDTLMRLKLPVQWDAKEIKADVVIFHNPSCLKFQEGIDVRLIARHLIVVTHENFLRPNGAPGFDVEKCLSQIASASLALRRSLAPISAWNRSTTLEWCRENRSGNAWSILDQDWFNICSFEKEEPTSTPKDRRGRHSRPGLEKFPGYDAMACCFPATADSNVILGADSFLRAGAAPPHWSLHPFGALTLKDYFDQIDFFVYFTSPVWRESFGRVIAEAIAAGKMVITDPETARTFGGAAIEATPEDVDQIVSSYIAEPDRYRGDILSAQEKLDRFSTEAFRDRFNVLVRQPMGVIP